MAPKTRKNADKALSQTALFSMTGSFNPTDFRFHQTTADKAATLVAEGKGVAPFRALPSVLLRTKQGFIGTNSVHLSDKKAKDQKEVDSRMSPNPGARDVATLGANMDTLVVVGGFKFVSEYASPTMCDNPAYAAYHAEFVQAYIADGNLPGLMRRYLANIVEGRILWRNQYGFSRQAVLSVRAAGVATQSFVLEAAEGADFERLVSVVSALAAKPKSCFLIEVALIIELGADAEVFPSQLFIQADDKAGLRGVDKKANYGRVLASRLDAEGKEQVILSANKVGNALRQVDLGYAEDVTEPIAVELYGAVMTQRVAHRYENGNSYFDLVTKKGYADMTEEERHYIMAVFLKGGLLGFSQDDKKSED